MMDKTDARPLADAIQEPTIDAWIRKLQERGGNTNTPVTWDELNELMEAIAQRIRENGT